MVHIDQLPSFISCRVDTVTGWCLKDRLNVPESNFYSSGGPVKYKQGYEIKTSRFFRWKSKFFNENTGYKECISILDGWQFNLEHPVSVFKNPSEVSFYMKRYKQSKCDIFGDFQRVCITVCLGHNQVKKPMCNHKYIIIIISLM